MAKLSAERKFQGSAFEDWLDAPPHQGLRNALDEAIAFFAMPGGESAPRAIEVTFSYYLKDIHCDHSHTYPCPDALIRVKACLHCVISSNVLWLCTTYIYCT
jgi:hypothetical protein